MAQPRFRPMMHRRRRLGALGALSPDQIQAVAANAGFTGDDMATAVAIALAESRGNSSAYNPELTARGGTPPGKGSVGLWQIYLKMHPEFSGLDLTDPQTNANAAYSIYSAAGGFTPWATYTGGQYRAFLQPAMAIPGAAPAPVLTLDASTGLPLDDSTPTPVLQANAAPPIMGLTLAGFGALLLYEILSD